MQDRSTVRYYLTGGNLVLDFINTLWRRRNLNRSELLVDYSALLAFGEQSGIIDHDDLAELRRRAGESESATRKVLRQAIELRESMYRIFSAIAGEREPSPDDLAILESWAGRAYQRGSLVRTNGHYEWGFGWDDDLRMPLWPIVQAAIELLRSPDLDRIRECAADDCGWMFIDRSRNKTRRWCTMSSCGNRAKAARYRERHTKASS